MYTVQFTVGWSDFEKNKKKHLLGLLTYEKSVYSLSEKTY